MKKNLYTLAARVCIALLLFSFTALHAQQRNLRTEVLVYILPDSLELPREAKGVTEMQNATVRSSELSKVLSETKASVIARAFPNWPLKDSTVLREDGVPVKMPSFHRIFTLTFSTEAEADAAIKRLQNIPAVLFAEKHAQPTLDNDPSYINGTQWHLNNNGLNGGTAGADINAEGAWAIFTGSSNTTIAIIDTGVEIGHDEFTGKATGETPSGSGHGTGVAGVAAARAMNGTGIRGVNWEAQILSKKIDDNWGQWIGDPDVAEKITDAVNEGADVLNCSWSFPDHSNTLAIAFAYAYKMNRVSVATMGNTGIEQTRYPGALTNVIAVGATQNNDLHSDFSTTGAHIDVVAPGGSGNIIFPERDIFTTALANGYNFVAGTSFAAPQVTGLASLLKGFQPNLSTDDIRQIIRLSADQVEGMGGVPFTTEYGFGRINAGAALQMLQAPNQFSQLTSQGGTIFSSTGNILYQFLSAGSLASGNYIAKRHEVRKAVTFPTVYCDFAVWGRGVSTTGWNIGNPNYGEGFCEVVPGTVTNTGATLRTYVYEVINILGQTIGWFPTTPANVTFAYSVLGIPDPNPNASVSGTSLLCTTNSTFTLNNLNQGTVTWTATPANLFATTGGASTSGPGTSAVVRAANTSASGQGFITFTIQGPDCSTSVVKNVWVGPRKPTGFVSVLVDPWLGRIKATVEPVPDATGYQWFLDGVQYTGPGMNSPNVTMPIPRNNCTIPYYIVGVKAINACGISAEYYELHQNPCYGSFLYTYFPNPASGSFTIERKHENNAESIESSTSLVSAANRMHTYALYDLNTNLVVLEGTLSEKTEIDVSAIPRGRYVLKIQISKEEEEKHHIILN